MSDLAAKHCKACKPGTPALDAEAARRLLGELHGWSASEDGKSISRAYSFKNYYETTAFVNALAWIAHREDHHPDLAVSYNRCVVTYSTHSVGGLSENDFICAAKADALLAGT
jgi:4a-hydroxytetrahydrobiopterin dehydratase